MRQVAIAGVVAAFLIGLTIGCGAPDKSADTPPEITLLCGGSFRLPVQKLVKAFEGESKIKVVLSFGQSEELLPHVRNRTRGDAFLTHDPFAQYTKDAGSESRTVVVGHLRPVLVVKKGNPNGIKALSDLARPGLRVGLPDPQYSTCGKMIVDLLKKKSIYEAVNANVKNAMFRQHGEVATAVKFEHCDVGMLWNGIAYGWLDSIEIVPTPPEFEEIKVTISGLNYSKQPEALETFLTFAQQRGPEIFAEFGYVK